MQSISIQIYCSCLHRQTSVSRKNCHPTIGLFEKNQKHPHWRVVSAIVCLENAEPLHAAI